jgi:hypothetical protein
LIWGVRSKSDGQGRSERGKAHLGFTVDHRRRGLRTGMELRRGSGLPWDTARMGRCSARRGGLGNVVSALDFVMPREREAAGEVRRARELRELV